MSLVRPLALLFALAAVAVGGVATGSSGAGFTASVANAGNTFSSARDWMPPTVTVTNPGSPLKGTVTFTATASDTVSGVASVRLEYARTGTTTFTTFCTATIAPYSCVVDTRTLADGGYDLRAVATDVDGNVGTSALVANRVIDNLAPVVALAPLAAAYRGTTTISATASDAGTGVTSVRIEYALSGATTFTLLCVDTTAPYSCPLTTTMLADDVYDFRAVASDGAGNTTISAIESTQIDNVVPAVTMVDPGSPLTGTVTLNANATDDDSGIDRVTIQYATSTNGTFIDVCTTSVEPFRCAFDTTKVADGLTYAFRAIAVDRAGNTTTSASVTNRQIDNTLASVTMNDPGDVLKGAVPLTATGSGALIANIAIQVRAVGAPGWTTVCTDTSAPYGCTLTTGGTSFPDGLYEFRAVMTYSGALTKTSAIVTNRRIDNTVFRGTDVKATNGGALTGKIEPADRLVFTWSQAPAPGSIVTGWSGVGTIAFQARLTDNLSNDTLTFPTATSLGSVNLKGNFIRKSRTANFNVTATLTGSTLTITFGAVTSGAADLRQSTALASMVWAPSMAVRDLANNSSSEAPVTESGAAGRDF